MLGAKIVEPKSGYINSLKLGSYLCLVLCAGCVSQHGDYAVGEVRAEVIDVRRGLNSVETELHLLEEKFQEANSSIDLRQELGAMRQKLAALQRFQETTSLELQRLATHAEETSAAFAQYRDRISELYDKWDDLYKLKSTLSSISSAVGAKQSASSRVHKIATGETLKKIAKKYHISIDALKQANNLKSDHIQIGQKLTIPDNE
jgi:LysM repeat protein